MDRPPFFFPIYHWRVSECPCACCLPGLSFHSSLCTMQEVMPNPGFAMYLPIRHVVLETCTFDVPTLVVSTRAHTSFFPQKALFPYKQDPLYCTTVPVSGHVAHYVRFSHGLFVELKVTAKPLLPVIPYQVVPVSFFFFGCKRTAPPLVFGSVSCVGRCQTMDRSTVLYRGSGVPSP